MRAGSLNQTDNFTGNGMIVDKVPLGALDTGGGGLLWQNPENGPIVVTRIEVDVTTKSTAAGTMDIGTTTTSNSTSSDNMLDGLDVGSATGLFNNIDDKGTNGKSHQRLAAGGWVTGSKASGALAGLVGNAYIHYFRI